jgi:succinate-acetate transporter protein
MSARDNWCDPGHWAVFAFATTSFMLGFVNSNFIASSAVGIVLPVSLLFGGLVQLMVAVLEVIRGNIFGACVFGTYGPFWIIYGLYVPFFSGSVAPASAGTSVALFLAMFAVMTFFFVIASFRTDWVLVAVFILIDVALILLAIGAGTSTSSITHIGGYVTIAFAVIAWYHALSGLVAGTFGRSFLPVGYIGPLAPKAELSGAAGGGRNG